MPQNPVWFHGAIFASIEEMGSPDSVFLFGVFCWKIFFFFWSFVFLGPHPRHMEVPRLGVESEQQLLAYARATATPDPSHVCELHHSSRQCQTLNPLSEARD